MEKLNSVEEIKDYLNQGKAACKQLIDDCIKRDNDMLTRRAILSYMNRYNTFEEVLARIEGRQETILALS